MSKILFAGFEGEYNSAKILLDKLSPNTEKLYLKNDFEQCAAQIKNELKKNTYHDIIAFGQKPVIKSIYIEEYGCIGGQLYKTAFQHEDLQNMLTGGGYRVKLSCNAGSYLCNHVYASGLRYIAHRKLSVNYLFIHIPVIKNLTDIDALADTIEQYSKHHL